MGVCMINKLIKKLMLAAGGRALGYGWWYVNVQCVQGGEPVLALLDVDVYDGDAGATAGGYADLTVCVWLE